MTNDRCKIGDIAIIIRDEIGCEANLGRIVRVCGPRKVDSLRGTVWRIEAVSGGLLSYLDDASKTIKCGKTAYIDHEDTWLLPIRPTDSSDMVDVAQDMPVPEVLEVV